MKIKHFKLWPDFKDCLHWYGFSRIENTHGNFEYYELTIFNHCWRIK